MPPLCPPRFRWVGDVLLFATTVTGGWFAASTTHYGPRYSGLFSRVDESWNSVMTNMEEIYDNELSRRLGLSASGANQSFGVESLSCLDWLVIGTHHRTVGDFGFAYHCSYMAHIKSEGRLGNVADLCASVADFEQANR